MTGAVTSLPAETAPLKEEKVPGPTLLSPNETERNVLTNASKPTEPPAKPRFQFLASLERQHPTLVTQNVGYFYKYECDGGWNGDISYHP